MSNIANCSTTMYCSIRKTKLNHGQLTEEPTLFQIYKPHWVQQLKKLNHLQHTVEPTLFPLGHNNLYDHFY